MVLQEIRGLKRNIAEVLNRYAIEKATTADASWWRPRFEKEQPEVELAAEVEEASNIGKWISEKVVRWIEERGFGLIKAKGFDVFAHSTCVKGTTKAIMGSVVFI